ncbi:hypothetical protein N8I77_009515 [Diaporthe amygdali]|uniref:Uncharacterized protein n=1 Tax=Phomopsis amygdali TaxID=1214568 RepID=A0AAD9SAB2_PHOAM|nr:hypothetical protein N8I77_009515 [Diaporthe amygdali]
MPNRRRIPREEHPDFKPSQDGGKEKSKLGPNLRIRGGREKQPPLRRARSLLFVSDDHPNRVPRLHHLLALLPPPDRVVALLEQVVQLRRPVHVLEELTLHLVLGESVHREC